MAHIHNLSYRLINQPLSHLGQGARRYGTKTAGCAQNRRTPHIIRRLQLFYHLIPGTAYMQYIHAAGRQLYAGSAHIYGITAHAHTLHGI